MNLKELREKLGEHADIAIERAHHYIRSTSGDKLTQRYYAIMAEANKAAYDHYMSVRDGLPRE